MSGIVGGTLGWISKLEKTMSRNQRRLVLGAGSLPVAAALTLGGCAAEGPVKTAGIERKIEAARTPADHQEIAAVYGQQAEGDRSAAERYRGLARAYERGLVWGGPPIGSLESVQSHAENLQSQIKVWPRFARTLRATTSKRQRRILRWQSSIAKWRSGRKTEISTPFVLAPPLHDNE